MTHWEKDGGFVGSAKEVLTHPTAYFQETPREGPIGRPLLYGVIVGTISFVFVVIWQAIWLAVQTGLSLAAAEDAVEGFLGAGLGSAILLVLLVVLVLLSPLFAALGILFNAGLYHLCLMMVGGAHRGYDASVRAVAYASTPALLAVVPCCGAHIGGIWAFILTIIALKEIHEISGGKAVAAVILPIVFLCCCIGLVALGAAFLIPMIVAAGG